MVVVTAGRQEITVELSGSGSEGNDGYYKYSTNLRKQWRIKLWPEKEGKANGPSIVIAL
jgi:hypothetical protein